MAKKSAPQLTQGALALAEAIAKEKLSVNAAGEAIEAPEGMFSRLLRGQRMPSVWWAWRIEQRFGVPMRFWAQGAEAPTEAAA